MKNLFKRLKELKRKEIVILLPKSEENQANYFFQLARPEAERKLQENISDKEDR